MISLIIVFVLVCLWRIRLAGFNRDYMSKQQTTAIKGIFTALIFFSHIRGYLQLPDCVSNNLYNSILDYFGQLIVAAFFLYSGFGIWLSWKSKPGYEHTFFRRRVLKVLVHFDIAVALYILVQLFLPIHYSIKQYLLCWIGWESVGNSNWFIFVILSLYLAALAGLLFEKKIGKGGIALTTVLSAAIWVFLHCVAQKPSWWVDTIIAFPLGMFVAEYKNEIDRLLNCNKYAPFVYSLLLTFIFLSAHHFWGIDIYGGVTLVFCLMLIAYSSWIKIGNPILDWMGRNAFTIYIIQRLPMIVFSHWCVNQHPAVFVVLTIIATILLAEGLSRFYGFTDKYIFAHA